MSTRHYGPKAVRAVRAQYDREKRIRHVEEYVHTPPAILTHEKERLEVGFRRLLDDFGITKSIYDAMVCKLKPQFEHEQREFEHIQGCYHYQKHLQGEISGSKATQNSSQGCFLSPRCGFDCPKHQPLTSEQKERLERLCDIDSGVSLYAGDDS